MDVGSVTIWLKQLKAGDADAAQEIWKRYHARLLKLASAKLGAPPRRAADEEDVVQAAFHSFCCAVEKERFSQLNDRDDLWQILVVLTARKAINQRKHQRVQKRGGGLVRGESAFGAPGDQSDQPGLQEVIGSEPTPEFAAAIMESYRGLLKRLDDPMLQSIAVHKLEGYTNEEIAHRLGFSLSGVERRLRKIREIWSAEEVA